jgi:phosphoribosyl-ATP pyrophosphohydrolase
MEVEAPEDGSKEDPEVAADIVANTTKEGSTTSLEAMMTTMEDDLPSDTPNKTTAGMVETREIQEWTRTKWTTQLAMILVEAINVVMMTTLQLDEMTIAVVVMIGRKTEEEEATAALRAGDSTIVEKIGEKSVETTDATDEEEAVDEEAMTEETTDEVAVTTAETIATTLIAGTMEKMIGGTSRRGIETLKMTPRCSLGMPKGPNSKHLSCSCEAFCGTLSLYI